MFFNALARLWKPGARCRSSRCQRPRRYHFRPWLEACEDRLVPSGIVWQDNMESGTNGWAVAGSAGKGSPSILWHLSETNSNSPTHA